MNQMKRAVIPNYFQYFALAMLASALVFFPGHVKAREDSPVGTWKTIDDGKNIERSIVKVWENKGKYYARVQKVFFLPDDSRICDKCDGKRKNKPIEGMVIMWGVEQKGKNRWDGGRILDPENGKIYRVKLRLTDNGKKMKVRGYIGFSLLGRTQIWHRLK